MPISSRTPAATNCPPQPGGWPGTMTYTCRMRIMLGAALALFAFGCARRTLPVTGQPDAATDGGAPLDAAVGLPDGASLAPCTAENTLYVEGDPGEPLHPGAETVSAATWMTLNATDMNTFAALIPAGSTQWEVAFSSLGLDQPLTPGYYGNAVTWPQTAHGHATFKIYPDRNPAPVCQSVTGWFYVSSIAGGPTSAEFTEIVAAFEQHCDGASAGLRGCINLRR